MRKVAMIILIALFLSSFVLSVSKEDYVPSWYESWDGAKGDGTHRNILNNFWDSLNPFANPDVDMSQNADVYGWYNGTFFGLANWEREICLTDTSNEVRDVRNVVGSEDAPEVYMTTISVSAKVIPLYNNTYLYEVSWYILPFNEEVQFRVYLTDGTAKEFFAGSASSWLSTDQYNPVGGYDAKYLNANLSKAVIEYKSGSYTDSMSVSVVKA